MKENPQHRDDQLKSSRTNGTLILFNDEVNTFDHVIKSLVEVCGHDPIQAEQCAMIVHFKGKCEVKKDLPEVLLSMSRSLKAKGLRTEVS
jgi:ATP-dependent Clp protease adaptor protein ClpS